MTSRQTIQTSKTVLAKLNFMPIALKQLTNISQRLNKIYGNEFSMDFFKKLYQQLLNSNHYLRCLFFSQFITTKKSLPTKQSGPNFSPSNCSPWYFQCQPTMMFNSRNDIGTPNYLWRHYLPLPYNVSDQLLNKHEIIFALNLKET